VDAVTKHGRVLEYEETVGRIVVLDYNKSILSENFNPSKFDFNPWDLDKHLEKDKKNIKLDDKDPGEPTISFRLYNKKSFQVMKGDRLGCAALIPTVGVPNLLPEDQELGKCFGERAKLQIWDSML